MLAYGVVWYICVCIYICIYIYIGKISLIVNNRASHYDYSVLDIHGLPYHKIMYVSKALYSNNDDRYDDRGVGYYTIDFPQEHAAFKINTLLASKWDLNLRRKQVKCSFGS